MSTFAKLLATLDRDRLHALCHRFGVPLLNKRDKDPAIEGLVSRVRPDQYVELFSKCNKEELAVMAKKLKVDPKARSLQALAERVAAALANETTAGSTTSGTVSPRKGGGRVFIVHGHDELMKTEVARMIEQWGMQAIILHEQPNKGKTVIEKLEHNSADADFAVVLLSPDDVGSAKGAAALAPRARQNVVLELGFFVAQLGRERVAVFHRPEVEVPSDINGLVYIPYPPGGLAGARAALQAELEAAGLL
jgi:predicted nucleotide-binding protein